MCASDTCIHLNVNDEELESLVEFNALFDSNEFARVRVRCHRVVGAKVSPFGGDPNSFERIGVLTESPWLDEIAAFKDKYSPGSSASLQDIEHYYFRGEDSTVEILCEDISWERV